MTKPTKTAANRRTNLGVLVLLAAITLFGVLAAIVNTTDNPVRFGLSLGIALSGALALCTFAVLVIRKAVAKPVAA